MLPFTGATFGENFAITALLPYKQNKCRTPGEKINHFKLVSCACAVTGKCVGRSVDCKHYANEVRSRLTFKLLSIFN